jgi:hypothetical protein
MGPRYTQIDRLRPDQFPTESTQMDGLDEGSRTIVKLRPTRQGGELAGSGLAPARRTIEGVGGKTGRNGQCYEVSMVAGVGVGIANASRRSSERFQGKKGWMSSGAFPPAAAQLSKYQVNHRRGWSFQWASVANSENIAAASRPLHRAPEP